MGKPLLYSVGAKAERGTRNVGFVTTDKVLIKIPHKNGKHEWIECKVKFGRKYLPLVRELIEEGYSYGAGATIKLKNKNEDWRSVFKKKLYLYLNIPVQLYVKYFEKEYKAQPQNRFYAGFDFNVDGINMVIVDTYGRMREIKNIHFPEVANLPKEKAKIAKQEALSKLVEYTVTRGVRYFVVENLEKPNKISGKVGRWALKEYLQQAEILVKKVNGKLIKVNPAYTSVDAIGVALAKELDKHTASAYLIALRGIERTKCYKMLYFNVSAHF